MLKEVGKVNKRFMFTSGGLRRVTGFLLKMSFQVPFMRLILTTHGKIFRPLIFIDV